eukprot:12803387-Ditylum_brightwellii.AAC.1
MLLHTKQYWPEYITTILWPYALKATEFHFNKYNIDEEGVSPEEKICNVRMVQNISVEVTWGCLVYVL